MTDNNNSRYFPGECQILYDTWECFHALILASDSHSLKPYRNAGTIYHVLLHHITHTTFCDNIGILLGMASYCHVEHKLPKS